jgi:hypothetical protein
MFHFDESRMNIRWILSWGISGGGIAKSQCERYPKKSDTALRAVDVKAAY